MLTGKKIHVDILTPKQVLFFNILINKLAKLGIATLLTTRKYREVNQMMKLKRIQAYTLGEHGGADRESKLEANLERTRELAQLFKEENPDVSLSFSSPETARVSFGLGIPHVTVNDSPHAEAVARLTIPLSKKLLTPYIIPFRAWRGYGATNEMIVRYNALDPFAWLRNFKPDENILKSFGVSRKETIVTVRPEESFASYLLDRVEGRMLFVKIIDELLKLRDITLIVLPRYHEQIEILKNKFNGKIVLAEKVVDGATLLFFSSIFVGGGGTMTTESALMGIPTFSFYPNKPTYVESFLVRKRLVFRENNPRLLASSVAQILKTIDESMRSQKVRARELTKTMEDPTEVVLKTIASYL